MLVVADDMLLMTELLSFLIDDEAAYNITRVAMQRIAL